MHIHIKFTDTLSLSKPNETIFVNWLITYIKLLIIKND